MKIFTWVSAYLFLTLSGFVAAQSHQANEGKSAQWRITSTADFELQCDTSHAAWSTIPWKRLNKSETSGVTYETKAKLLYSQKGIYVLFWCEDYKISATITQHNADIYLEDVVEIFFWTDEKYPLYFEYELSPLNYELVLLVPNFQGKFLGWIPWHYEDDRLTRHATKIIKEGENVKGWVAEIFIPYALLEPLNLVPPKRGTRWRMNLYRIDYDQGSTEWWWQPVKKTFHDFKRFGTLVFD